MIIIKALSIMFAGYFIIYTILKAISANEYYRESQQPHVEIPTTPRRVKVEITSNDLYMKAENIIATHDVLALQAEQIQHDIDTTEEQLEQERKSVISNKSDVHALIKHSLNLQQAKCKLEAQMIKLMDELDKVAREEYKRKAV